MTVVAKVSEIPDGESKVVEFEGTDIAIFNIGGEFFAICDMCPHAGGPLNEGFLNPDDKTVACPWHGWTFSLDPAVDRPPSDMVERYRVVVEGEDVTVEKCA